MINAQPSNINHNKVCYHNVLSVASYLNTLRNKNKEMYLLALDLINGSIRDLYKLSMDNSTYKAVTCSVSKKISNFKLFSEIYSVGAMKSVTENLCNSVNIILQRAEQFSKEEINSVRGMLTEAVACSYVGDVKHQVINGLIWDCCFEKNNELLHIVKGKRKVKSTDIYYKSGRIKLCECKTSPFFESLQFDFLKYIQEEYRKENEEIDLYTFVLQYKDHPGYQETFDKVPNFITIKTIDDIRKAL